MDFTITRILFVFLYVVVFTSRSSYLLMFTTFCVCLPINYNCFCLNLIMCFCLPLNTLNVYYLLYLPLNMCFFLHLIMCLCSPLILYLCWKFLPCLCLSLLYLFASFTSLLFWPNLWLFGQNMDQTLYLCIPAPLQWAQFYEKTEAPISNGFYYFSLSRNKQWLKAIQK